MQWKNVSKLNVFVLKRNKIKKCNAELVQNFLSDKKRFNSKLSTLMTSAQKIIDQEIAQFR